MTSSQDDSDRATRRASTKLNRAAELRTRAETMEALESHEDARFTFTWRNRNLVTSPATGDGAPQPVFVDRAAAASMLGVATQRVFLGLQGDTPYFAASLPGADANEALAKPHGAFNDLRMLGQFVAAEDARLLAYARGVLHWHRHQQHCGKCGAKTVSSEGGHVRVCSGCGKRLFPRTDPAIMALIVRGDSVLVARQPKWPPSMYSILAGFVEPGESIEEAVVREVREEVGLEVEGVTYVRSQPWPFPASLMIGFAMRYKSGEIHLGDDELEEARWVTRGEIQDNDNALFVPPTFSLAGQLLELFLSGELTHQK